ncbi:MAG: NifB/NifX family molybdenum-iron cluster-binding protein [Ruminococcus sp.]|nr:NifB/NifX family molybdenum-iron cluster-binding protein [Ruminococcus sp.]
MKIAVTYENGSVFQHFGHTAQFKIYDIEDNKIISEQIVDTMGSGHGALAGFLSSNNVNVLICGGIGEGAKNALKDAAIQVFGGVSGSADVAVQDYLAGNLLFNPFIKCNHHGHGHEHTCGEHGCGKH